MIEILGTAAFNDSKMQDKVLTEEKGYNKVLYQSPTKSSQPPPAPPLPRATLLIYKIRS